ncbi:MAG: hypothetical protein ABIP13_10710 [Tepidiformaceae bacterium]
MSDLPPLNEENAGPGTPLKPYHVTFTADSLAPLLSRTGESLDAYVYMGEATVPPGAFLGAYGRLIHETFDYSTGVHVSSDMKVSKAVPVGTEARVSGEILRLYERNGDKYVSFMVNIDDEAGGRIAEVEHSSIYAFRSRA